jgi:hypothetical protein
MISLRTKALLAAAALSLAFGLLPSSPSATTWYVPSPCPTIQAGIDSAAAGDTVEVACGTYSEHAILMKSGVHLKSQSGQPDCVTIDAGLLDRVLVCDDLNSNTIIEGFTITGGSLPPANEGGAGIHCYNSSAKFWNCDIVNNTAGQAGGGMFIDGGSPQVQSCKFLGNSAPQGGGVLCKGISTPSLSNCVIAGNSGTYGGGVRCKDGASPQFLYTALVGNSGTYGGAVNIISSSAPVFLVTTIASNMATERGGGVYGNAGVTPSFMNTILYENCASSLGQQLFLLDVGSIATFTCCDVDTTPDWKGGSGGVTWAGANYSEYPIFCDPQPCYTAPFTASCSDEYSVRASSSVCVPPNNSCGQIGACGGLPCTVTFSREPVLEASTWSRVKATYR